MFDKEIKEVREFLDRKKAEKKLSDLKFMKKIKWPEGGGKNIVLKDDVGIELGSPEAGSCSFLLWTDDAAKIRDGRITLVGSDLPKLYKNGAKNLPFGKVLLIGVHGFNEENTYDRYREMELLRYDVDLKGYMMKAVSQYQREWSRVSIEAMDMKFSFSYLGSDLIRRLKEKEFVDAVEVIFVTSNREDVTELQDVSTRVGRVIAAMNKMLEEMSFDCSSCEFEDVCDEVDVLKDIRNSLEAGKEKGKEKGDAV